MRLWKSLMFAGLGCSALALGCEKATTSNATSRLDPQVPPSMSPRGGKDKKLPKPPPPPAAERS